MVRQTSSTHGQNGYITTVPADIAEANERLDRKLTANVDRFSFYEQEGTSDAETLVVTYGVTARAARMACRELVKQGLKVGLLVLKTLWPVPEKVILEAARSAKKVVVAEMNLGQYVLEVNRILKDRPVTFTGGMNGKLVSPARIMEAVRG